MGRIRHRCQGRVAAGQVDAGERQPEEDPRVARLVQRIRDVIQHLHHGLLAALLFLGDDLEHDPVDRLKGPLDHGAHQGLAAAEMVQHRRVRHPHVGRHLLQTDSRWPRVDQPPLCRIQDGAPCLLRRASPSCHRSLGRPSCRHPLVLAATAFQPQKKEPFALLTMLFVDSMNNIVNSAVVRPLNQERIMDLTQTLASKGYDFPRASRAIQALIRNPDDLPKVFTVIEALSGDTPRRLMRQLKQSSTGQRMLREKPDIAVLLRDRQALRALPEGSLGRAYLQFIESEGISAEGIAEASVQGESRERTDDFRWLHDRLRDSHDLWHAVTGYKGDLAGEIALLAFSLGQTFNPAIALIVSAALLQGMARERGGLVLDGYLRGRKARWFAEQPWEDLLALPVAQIRDTLRVGPPPSYDPIRSAQLRAEGFLAPV